MIGRLTFSASLAAPEVTGWPYSFLLSPRREIMIPAFMVFVSTWECVDPLEQMLTVWRGHGFLLFVHHVCRQNETEGEREREAQVVFPFASFLSPSAHQASTCGHGVRRSRYTRQPRRDGKRENSEIGIAFNHTAPLTALAGNPDVQSF